MIYSLILSLFLILLLVWSGLYNSILPNIETKQIQVPANKIKRSKKFLLKCLDESCEEDRLNEKRDIIELKPTENGNIDVNKNPELTGGEFKINYELKGSKDANQNAPAFKINIDANNIDNIGKIENKQIQKDEFEVSSTYCRFRYYVFKKVMTIIKRKLDNIYNNSIHLSFTVCFFLFSWNKGAKY